MEHIQIMNTPKNDPDFKEIGKLIASFRHQNKWTAEELKNKLEISTPTLSRIENGRQGPNAGVIKKLAALGMDIQDLTYASRFHSKEQSISYRLTELENKFANMEKMIAKIIKVLELKP